MEYLYFGDNQIKYIGYNTFANIKNLSHATFQFNKCITFNAHSKEEVKTLIDKAHAQCIPNEEIVGLKICGDKMEELVNENGNLKSRLELMTAESRKMYSMRHQNANLSAENTNLRKKIEELVAGQKYSKNDHDDYDMENKINMLEAQLKGEKPKEEKSTTWKWILMTLGGFAVIGCAVAYLKYNQLLMFNGNFNSERLT